jgi:hypothetical protein
MKELKRGEKIYLDKDQKIESTVNQFLECRDGVVELYEYTDGSGYGSSIRLFYCQNTKHEVEAIIRQTYSDMKKIWLEESMFFGSDDIEFLKAILIGKQDVLGGTYSVIRDYNIDK